MKDFFIRALKEGMFSAPSSAADEIRIANEKAKAQGGLYRQPVSDGIVEIGAYDTDGNLMNGRFSKSIDLSLAFTRSGGNAASSAGPKIRARTLSLWALDRQMKMWRNLTDPSIDTTSQRVGAKVQSFGVYAIIGAPDFSLDQVIVYPIPWRPHSGNPLTGNETDGISFDLLPSECGIQIFTISGERVREIQHSGGDAIERWDVRTARGEPVASGLYIYLIKTPTGHRTGKLIVIR